jgi:O-antigen biosynthesis protein
MTLPNVSVITPVYGRSNLVLRMVNSLREQKRLGEIILIDDHGPENDATVLKTIEGVKLYTNSGNEGFVKSNRRGASKASNDDYLLFLNSDTEALHPHCLERMAESLDDGAAVVGALLLYPKTDQYRAECIQHCGVFFDARGFPMHIMSGYPGTTPMAQVRRRVPVVTGACLMTTRKWWDKLGGFDLALSPGTFEDVDYCIRVGKLGGEIVYEPKATFYHYEHASQGQGGINWFSNENLHRNFTYIMTKHGQQPPSDSFWFKGL